MRKTKLDRMEHIEDILMQKIENLENEIETLGRMTDPEICRLRVMYYRDLGEMRNNLLCLRRRMDIEYCARRLERKFHDEIANFGKMPGAGAEHEANRQCWKQEPACGGGAGGCVRHVRPDAAEHPGDDEGETLRTMKDWQYDAMMPEPVLKF